MRRFATYLDDELCRLGWSTPDLARYSGVSRQTAHSWRTGASVPRWGQLERLSDALGWTEAQRVRARELVRQDMVEVGR